MTKKEFKKMDHKFEVLIRRARNRLDNLEQGYEALRRVYAEDALAESEYSVGDPYVDKNGVTWFITGAFEADGYVFLRFNFSKKDGTMSKISGLGHGMPRVKIK